MESSRFPSFTSCESRAAWNVRSDIFYDTSDHPKRGHNGGKQTFDSATAELRFD